MRRAVVQTDSDGVVTGWNQDASDLFGYDAARAIGARIDFIVPTALRKRHWAGFERAMAEPEIRDRAADMPVLCADGSEREFPARLLVLSDGLGTAIGAMGIFTERGTTGVHPFA